MVNRMKGKGWRPVVFDPAVVYNTDGTQQSGPEPVEALWPWHGQEPAGGWPEDKALTAAPPAGNAANHQGKGYGSSGPPRTRADAQLGTPALVSPEEFGGVSALCQEKAVGRQRTQDIDDELAARQESERLEQLLQERINAGCEAAMKEGKARQAALADAQAARQAALDLEIAKGNKVGKPGKGKEPLAQRRWGWSQCPPVEAAMSKTPPGTPRSLTRSPKGRPLEPSPEDVHESNSRRKKEQSRELSRSSEGNASSKGNAAAEGEGQEELARLIQQAKETQLEYYAQQEQIALLEDAARTARDARVSDDALALVCASVSQGKGSASSGSDRADRQMVTLRIGAPPAWPPCPLDRAISDTPLGNVYGAVPPPANYEDEPEPSAPSKGLMGVMD
jgi:hypothetical protein